MLRQLFRRRFRGQPRCAICNEPVSLETAKTDQGGQAVHEDCYAAETCLAQPSDPIKKPTEEIKE